MTPGPRWRVGLVTISDSFQAAVRHLVSELGGALIDGRPHTGEPWPQADATLILAGGEESAGVDLLVDSKAGGPRFLIGAAADHRIAAAALQNGAADYFALPADLDLLRRRLEREARRSGDDGRAIAVLEPHLASGGEADARNDFVRRA